MPKNIAVFADGTGNSSAKLFKTNVWRAYQVLDIREPPPGGRLRQTGYYHDGVGTSSFRPLALIGGMFGWGLKRSVLDLYKFICRNYEPNDHLYLFGFSRGAFTVRVLAGFIAQEGLVADTGNQDLETYAKDAYRSYRRLCYPANMLVRSLRNFRDFFIRGGRKAGGHRVYTLAKENNRHPKIEFIGVWDTVSAYGLPIAELTRGVDKWVWPLSMPGYQLSHEVKTARHALALDDERDTFHPLLWDERHEQDPDRIKQVWFAGVHSDVGGGYPDDSLAYVPLDWMLGEAANAGLHFLPTATAEISRIANYAGQLHDSRRGLGGYYRYQPRKISARIDPPDQTTLLMQDPHARSTARLCRVYIHQSVMKRIEMGTDRYAPIVLPGDYRIIPPSNPPPHPVEPYPKDRAGAQERVWNWVWHKRVNYFMSLGVSLYLAGLPLWNWLWPPSSCAGVQCLLTPIVLAIGEFVPGFAQPWIATFAYTPGRAALATVVLAALLIRSSVLQDRIRTDMRALWEGSLGLPAVTSPPPMTGRWVWSLRSWPTYQRGLQWLKWKALPNGFGPALLALILATTVYVCGLVILRINIWVNEYANLRCAGAPEAAVYETSMTCLKLPGRLEEKKRYRITLVVSEPWIDNTISTTPEGFGAARMSFIGNLMAPFRPAPDARWFQPLIKIVPEKGLFHIDPLEMRLTGPADGTYMAEFTATRSGPAYFFVDDVLLPEWTAPIIGLLSGLRLSNDFYSNNHGRSSVRIDPLPEQP